MENVERLKKIKALAEKLIKEIELLEAENTPPLHCDKKDIDSDVADGLKGLIEGFGN